MGSELYPELYIIGNDGNLLSHADCFPDKKERETGEASFFYLSLLQFVYFLLYPLNFEH